MEIVKELSLSKVRLMEFFQTMSNVKSFLAQEDLDTLKLKEIKAEFDAKLSALDQALKPLAKSSFTEKIQKLDEQRDGYLSGLLLHCQAFTYSPVEEKQEAAKKLLALIKKYGKNIQNKALQEETGILTNLLSDFNEQEAQQHLLRIDAIDWIVFLTEVNEKLNEAYNQRTEERGAIEVGKSKQARNEMNLVFTKLIKTINALALLNGEDAYRPLADNLNELIKKARL